MNRSFLKIAALGALLTTSASAASYTINLSGSTAFRSSVHSAIVGLLTTPTYAYTDVSSKGRDKATYVIFKGTIGTDNYTIRCTWTGSVAGVVDVASQNVLPALPTTTTTTAAPGTALVNANESSFATATMVSDGAMSDVYQSSTPATATITDRVVAVAPFKFIASKGATITNMTPQIFRAVFGAGGVPLSVLSGNPADTAYAIGIGRDSSSGTRATAMAETGYGISIAPQQYTISVAGSSWSASDAVGQSPTGGYTSGGTLAGDMAKQSSDGTVAVGYVGVADFTTGDVELSYNGVFYSAAAVYNGTYTFWTYEHLFTPTRVSGASSGNDLASKNFLKSMGDSLAANPGSSGLNPALMNVHRDGDGATVLNGALP